MEGLLEHSTSFDGRLIFFEIPLNAGNDIIGGIAWTKRTKRSSSPKCENNETREEQRGWVEEKRRVSKVQKMLVEEECFLFFSLLLLFSFLEPSSLGVCWVSDEPGCRPVCPGAVSAMDKLMMRGAHHRQLDIRLRQRDAMLYTIQVRDKRKDLRARRIGTSRGGLERALERICASTSPLVSTNRGNRIGSGCTKSRVHAKFWIFRESESERD